MKKLICAVLCVCLMMAVLAGCGAAPAPAEQEAPAASAPAEGTDVDYTQGDKHQFVAATGVVMDNPIQLAVTEFNKRVTELTGGRITFDEYHNSALGSERDLLEQESQGLVDCVGGGSQVAYNFVTECGLFDLPYLFMSNDHCKAVLKSDIGQGILANFEGTGIKPLSWLTCGWRNVTSNTPLNGPEDMKGIKIRVQENQVYIDMFAATGAAPTPMAFTELYTALQQGTVDAEDNPLIVINSAKFDEVQKYIYLTEHTASVGILSFSQSVFDSLSDADQQLLMDVAADMLDYSFEASETVTERSLNEITGRGNAEVVEVDKEAWAAVMTTIYEKYVDQYGADLVDSIKNFEY